MSDLCARLDDETFGRCDVHDQNVNGTITTAASKSKCEGKLIARVGDTVTASCGHTGTISEGSSSVITEGEKTARKGDAFIGVYHGTIIGSAIKTFVGD